MKQLKIGLLYTESELTNITRWYSKLSAIGDVSLLLPHERSMRYDVLIIPEAGINTNLNAFKHKNFIAVGCSTICPLIEMFRIESLDYYHSNGVPIIAVGQSNALLFDILSLKCALVEGIPVLLAENLPEIFQIVSKDGVFITEFECHTQTGDLYGLQNINSQKLFGILNDIKKRTISGEMDSLQNVTVDSPNPPSLTTEEGWG